MSCYALLRESRLPWPSSSCLDSLTPFLGSDERWFRNFFCILGASRIALRCLPAQAHWASSSIRHQSFLKNTRQWSGFLRANLEFENKLTYTCTPRLLIICFTRHDSTFERPLSWGKLQREPANKWFDESFAALQTSDKWFARQHCFGLPPEFPLASAWACKGHASLGSNQRCSDESTWNYKGFKPWLSSLRFSLNENFQNFTFISPL